MHFDDRWLAARDAGTLVRVDSLRKGAECINVHGSKLRYIREGGPGVHYFEKLEGPYDGGVWKLDGKVTVTHAGCAEVILLEKGTDDRSSD